MDRTMKVVRVRAAWYCTAMIEVLVRKSKLMTRGAARSRSTSCVTSPIRATTLEAKVGLPWRKRDDGAGGGMVKRGGAQGREERSNRTAAGQKRRGWMEDRWIRPRRTGGRDGMRWGE